MSERIGRGMMGDLDPQLRRRDRRLAAPLFFVVLAVYVLTYSGGLKSNDERALFSGMDSFVKRGAFTINQIYWDYTNVGMLTASGEMVPNYEPAQMVLAVPAYLWGRAMGAGVQGVMFFGAIVTALTAAVLYLCLLELKHSRKASLIGTLVFAFATQAWPHSRTFFREPLTVLAYLVAVYALLRYRPPAPRRLLWPVLLGTAIGVALTNKQVSVAVLPSLLLMAGVYEWRRLKGDRTQRFWPGAVLAGLAALVPVIVLLGLGELYKQTTLASVETFARDLGEFTTNPQISSSLPFRLLRGSLGLTISPYKGLFWYSPVLLLAFAGVVPFLRRHPWEGLAFLMAAGAHLAGYSRYLFWSGGVVWGSRYMLQIIPFLVFLAMPVLAWLVGDGANERKSERARGEGRGGRLGRVAVVALIVLSFGVQVLGVTLDWRAYELRFLLEQAEVWGGIGEAIDALYLHPAYSPVLGHLQLLLSGGQLLDFAWVQLREQGGWSLLPVGLGLSLLLVGLAVAGLIWVWRRPGLVRVVSVLLGVTFALGLSALLLVYRTGDARYDPYNVHRYLAPMTSALAETCGAQGEVQCCRASAVGTRTCDNVLLVPDPTLTDYFLNYLDAPLTWYALEPQPVPEDLLDQLLAQYGRVWLARDRNAATDDAEGRRGVERYLAEHAYKVDEQVFGDWARLLSFSAAGHTLAVSSPEARLGEMILAEVSVGLQDAAPPPACADDGRLRQSERAKERIGESAAGAVRAGAGDVLQLGLKWQAVEAPQANYTVFVQLLDAAGQVHGQRDRWPGDGLHPTLDMAPGELITDNLALRLDVPAGHYRVIAGMYRNDVEGYPRLTGPGGDYVSLVEVDVE